VSSADHKAPSYEVFTTAFLPRPSYPKYFPQHPILDSALTGRIFMNCDILRIFQKSVEKIQASVQPDKNNG
jgi:hypothetical protein